MKAARLVVVAGAFLIAICAAAPVRDQTRVKPSRSSSNSRLRPRSISSQQAFVDINGRPTIGVLRPRGANIVIQYARLTSDIIRIDDEVEHEDKNSMEISDIDQAVSCTGNIKASVETDGPYLILSDDDHTVSTVSLNASESTSRTLSAHRDYDSDVPWNPSQSTSKRGIFSNESPYCPVVTKKPQITRARFRGRCEHETRQPKLDTRQQVDQELDENDDQNLITVDNEQSGDSTTHDRTLISTAIVDDEKDPGIQLTLYDDQSMDSDEHDKTSSQFDLYGLHHEPAPPPLKTSQLQTYDDIVKFCRNLNAHKYYRSLPRSSIRKKLIMKLDQLEKKPNMIKICNEKVDLSEAHYMHAAPSTRHLLVFVISAFLKITRFQLQDWRKSAAKNLYFTQLRPFECCLKEHCNGDIRTFIKKWGDPVTLENFSCKPSSCGLHLEQTPIEALQIAKADNGHFKCMNYHSIQRMSSKQRLDLMRSLDKEFGHRSDYVAERKFADLIRSSAAAMKCLRDHFKNNDKDFVDSFERALPFTKFRGNICPGKSTLNRNGECGLKFLKQSRQRPESNTK